MDLREAEARLTDLDFDQGFSLIYSLLEAYDFPKASITRLKSGDFNSASEDDELLWKNRVWFRFLSTDHDIHLALDDAQRNNKIASARPRFFIVSDGSRIAAADRVTGQTLDVPLGDLPRHVAFFWPWTGAERTVIETDRQADIKAAQRMAKLYEEVRKRNDVTTEDEAHELNVFFCRLLFCFFAEDTGVFEKGSFTSIVASLTNTDGSDLSTFLDDLFLVLNTEESQRSNVSAHFADFPWVNGDLFKYRTAAPTFTTRARSIILECSELDWSEISPDIFGSMMQSVVLVSDRKDVGMHYTSPANIMKVLRPLFLDDLDTAYLNAQDDVKKLDKLQQRISRIKVFDPACGSGNFLVLAYKELRALENRILQRKLDILGYEGGALVTLGSEIKLDHFYGIDIDEFATEVARLSLWLAKHQMNLQFRDLFSVDLSLVPLKDAGKITCENAARIDWMEFCPATASDETYVCGNPPYLGGTRQSTEHKADLRYAFGDDAVNMYLDYVSIWLLRAAQYAETNNAVAGLVTTNSVCQGNHVSMLWPRLLSLNIEIAFGTTSFRWQNEAPGSADITCAIIGLATKGRFSKKALATDGSVRFVDHISPYLVEGSDTIVSPTRTNLCNLPPMVFGSMPRDGGHLLLSESERNQLLEETPSLSASIHRFMGAEDFLHDKRRYCLVIDDSELGQVTEQPFVQNRLNQVAEYRRRSSAASTRRFAEHPNRFVQWAHQGTPAIVIPRVSSERRDYVPLGFVGADVVLNDQTNAIYNAEAWLFGLLQSRMHMVWVRAVAGRLKTDIRYSSTLTYNTFPVVSLGASARQMLSDHAFDVLRTREQFFDRTIAQLYDADLMPPILRDAHIRLDEAVDRLYRPKAFGSDQERLAALFDMYTKSTSREALEQERIPS